MRARVYLRFSRPFTLLPPLLGMVSGSLAALGALAHRHQATLDEVVAAVGGAGSVSLRIALGAVLAAALNAGSNMLNQWTDLVADRINKPHRPLVTGEVTTREAAWLIVALYAVAVGAAFWIRPGGRLDTLWVVIAGALLTLAYSCPPVRTKRQGTAANVTIATARGCLLKVAGWSCVAPVFGDPEPWFVGVVFALFLVGASSTKDFADMPGDRAAGCRTWPIAYGPARAARMMAPFFVAPWLLVPLGLVLPGPGRARLLTGDPALLPLVAIGLAAYGVYVARLVLRDPDALARTENHPSWTHMYWQMMAAQVGLTVAYLV